MRSFNSNENIHKKEGVSYYVEYPKWLGAKDAWSRGEERKRERGEKEKKGRKNEDQIKVCVHLFPLRSRHFLDQSEIRYLG